MADAGKWGDLGPRVGSAIVMIAALGGALYGPQPLYWIFVAIVSVLAHWELARLCEPDLSHTRRIALALLPLLPVVFSMSPWDTPGRMAIALVLAPAVVGLVLLRAGWVIWAAYAVLLGLGVYGLVAVYAGLGPNAVIALVALVAIVDILGYFAGRIIGGPKFWPRVSPKKTWSGTVAGWVGAAAFATFGYGALLGTPPAGPFGMILGAVALALAGQMGDIAESAMKRRVGIKDSSNLIPGHGGVLDRIDALIAVAALIGIVHLPWFVGA